MKNKFNKIKLIALFVAISSFLAVTPFIYSINAKCPENVVPNILDPNCELAEGQQITIGSLISRVVVFLPYIVTVIAVGALLWGAIKIMINPNEEGRRAGIQIWINTGIALVLFFSLGLILLVISIFTGYDLLNAIGIKPAR